MDFNASGSLTMRYVSGTTGDLVDAVFARESASGAVAWYLPDRLGTNRDMIDDSGSIIDHVDYGAFGNQLDESAPANGDRLMGFAGMERDTDTGMNEAVYRVQNPATGRWTSQDPLSFAAGDANLYRYVSSLPVSYRDPSGEGIGDSTGLHIFERDWPHSPAYAIEFIIAEMKAGGCKQDQIDSALEDLYKIFRITGNTRGRSIQDNCYAFINNCEAKFAKTFQPPSKYFRIRVKKWSYPDPFLRRPENGLSHGAFEITVLCGNAVFYIDDGWWGGESFNWFSNSPAIFWPSDVPTYVTPFTIMTQ